MEQRSVVEADRLLVAAVPMAPSCRHRDHDAKCICLSLTHSQLKHGYYPASPRIRPEEPRATTIFALRATENAARTGELNQYRFRSGSGRHEGGV